MIRATDLLQPDRPILLDGGVGTGLMKRGLEPGQPPELWNLERPGEVLDLHRSFVEAGSHVIETNTFGANPVRLRMTGEDASPKDIIAAACGLALEAADGRALVAGSVGPLGELIEPHGRLSVDDARDAYREVIETLMMYNVDIILIETMMSVDEAQIALRQALIAGASVVAVSMNFDPTPKGPRTAFGESPTVAVKQLQEAGAHIVGSNCGAGLNTMLEVARECVSVARVPVIIQPNAGIPETLDGVLHYPETPDSFATCAKEMIDGGVRYIGVAAAPGLSISATRGSCWDNLPILFCLPLNSQQ